MPTVAQLKELLLKKGVVITKGSGKGGRVVKADLEEALSAISGRGSSTRGWGMAAPRKGKERTQMMKECGQKCFLGPEMSFPICSKGGCTVDCRGIKSAQIRAAQYKYPQIEKRAKRMYNERC